MCDQRCDPLQLWRIVIDFVGQHSAGTVNFLLLEDRCNHCRIVAERRDHPAVLELLAVVRTADGCSNYYKHYAVVVDRPYNIGRIRWGRKRTFLIAALGVVGFGNLQMGFETKELAD